MRCKPLFAGAVSCLCFWLLSQQITQVNVTALWPAVQSIAAWQWLVAVVATIASFWAMGGYDVLWHRQFTTGVPTRTARISGMAALAIAQTVGFGAVTGTFLRWHLLDPLPLRRAGMITLAVCGSFLICWAVIALLAGAWLGHIPVVGVVAVGSAALCFFAVWRNAGWVRERLPLVPRLFALALADLVFAAVTLWVLLPDPAAIPYTIILAAFVLAIGAGLISNAPGGLGAFELVLLSLITTVPQTEMVAGILAFRLVYYFIPALCGAAVLISAHLRGPRHAPTAFTAPNGDLCQQGATVITHGAVRCVARQHLFGTVVLEPTTWDFHNAPYCVDTHHLYKCTPQIAAQARKHGWCVARIASDAVIDPQSWSADGPKRSQLRRKLRQADKAGVTVRRAGANLPEADMACVATAWAKAHGGELGYTMGRYDPTYVAQQHVYLIHHRGALVGFVSVQTHQHAWTVDLIRHVPGLPHGAMHKTIAAIIADAAPAGVRTLSLGAVPDGPDSNPLLRLSKRQKAGLRQFKSAFGPNWQPRYHAAPSRVQFFISLLAITCHIQRPWARLKIRAPRIQGNLMKMPNIIHLPQHR